MKKIYYIVLFLTLLFSCIEKNKTVQKLEFASVEFVNQISIPYKEIDTDYLLSYPKCIILTDSFLVIQDDKGHQSFYHVIDRMSGLLRLDFAKKGNGSDEILSTTLNPMYDKQENVIHYFDRDKRSYHYYNIDQSKTSSTINIRDEMSKYDIFLLEFFDLGNYYLGTGMNGALNNNRFAVFNRSLELINTFEKYPTFDSSAEKNQKLKDLAFNINLIKISPNRLKVVYASYKIGLLEIFSLGELPNKISKVKSLLLTHPMKGEDNIWGFEDVYVTDNFIYTLHNGKTADENLYYSRSIKVFDWNGEPIIEYNTGIDMRCIAVDEENKTIYAVAYSDEKGFFLIQTEQISHLLDH